MKWDFGEVVAGEKPEREFVVKNTGGAPLIIHRVLESCDGCFEFDLAKDKLQPDERTTLKITVLTARRRGSFRKYAYLESNDPATGRKRITVTGTIKVSGDGEADGGPTLEEELEQEIEIKETALHRGSLPVCVTYFTSSTCEKCGATDKALKKLQRLHGSVEVREFDIYHGEALNLLCEMEKTYGPFKHAPPIIYVGTELLDGWVEVKRKLGPTINARLEDGKAAEWPPEVAGTSGSNPSASKLICDRFSAIGPVAIVGAGLVDGINPCAFATIVFFVSLLARFGKSRREILVVGVCFTLAVFATYLLLGIGLLKAIKAFSVTTGIARGITYAVAALAAILGGYSLHDYLTWRKNRSGAEMKLKLPRGVHRRIHAVMKAGLSARSLVIAALVTGVCVSLLESVCTGQVYVPIIMYVLRDTTLRLHAVGYLVLYNVMFVLPLVVIFVLAYFGLQSTALASLAQRHTGTTKLLLTAVFFGLAVLLFATAR